MPEAVQEAVETSKKRLDIILEKIRKIKIPDKVIRIVVIVVIIALLALIGFLVFKKTGYYSLKKPAGGTLDLGPVRPLPSGRQVYNYSSTGLTGPVPSQVIIDPQTPKVGDKQTVQIKIKYGVPITKIDIDLYTDNKITKYPLKLVAGTSSDGTWEGTWTMPNSYDHNYYFKFDIRSDKENYEGGLRLR